MISFVSRLTGRGVFVAVVAVLAAFLFAVGVVKLAPVLFMHLLNLILKGQL